MQSEQHRMPEKLKQTILVKMAIPQFNCTTPPIASGEAREGLEPPPLNFAVLCFNIIPFNLPCN